MGRGLVFIMDRGLVFIIGRGRVLVFSMGREMVLTMKRVLVFSVVSRLVFTMGSGFLRYTARGRGSVFSAWCGLVFSWYLARGRGLVFSMDRVLVFSAGARVGNHHRSRISIHHGAWVRIVAMFSTWLRVDMHCMARVGSVFSTEHGLVVSMGPRDVVMLVTL